MLNSVTTISDKARTSSCMNLSRPKCAVHSVAFPNVICYLLSQESTKKLT